MPLPLSTTYLVAAFVVLLAWHGTAASVVASLLAAFAVSNESARFVATKPPKVQLTQGEPE